ncbi:MAG: cellulase family glycosylhydrolase [Prevotella sp.]|nr:cellulase family glycosylhydrolase [Prevotella sp.]
MKRLILLSSLLAAMTAGAKIELPQIVGDNMVLQQLSDARLWGKATAGAIVSAKADWLQAPVTAKADAQGRWQLTLKTPAAEKREHQIVLSENGQRQLSLSRVLIGEVWFASGQSNMEMPLEGFWNCPVKGSNEVIATAAENPWVRVAPIKQNGQTKPVEDCPGQWQVPSPETAPYFSATGWFFAQMLQRVLDVPVGVIACAWGGSKVEGWLPEEIVKTYDDVDIAKEQKEGWNGSWWHYYTPCIMYNGMLHPLRHYTVRGFLWYQGESNVGKDQTYPYRLKTMVDTWRREFGGTAEQLPFYFVEIAPWGGYGDWLSAPIFRECQHKAARIIENSGIISTNDLVEPYELNQIHPAEKREVGNRLAYMALNRTYGKKSIHCDSPEFDHIEVQGAEIEVFFKYAEQGLSPWQDITGFEVAGADGQFQPAVARLNESHKTVMVSSPQVSAPTAVRYCFKSFQPGNLKSVRGLPVVPFRSDADFETAAQAVLNMTPGWNLGNSLDCHGAWVPQRTAGAPADYEKAWGQPVADAHLMAAMKQKGFRGIRVPVTWYQHMDATGRVDEAWMDRVQQVVDYVISAGMYCILNVHHDTGAHDASWLRADSSSYTLNHQRYENLWRQIAERFADYDERLLFEGYNEMLDNNKRWSEPKSIGDLQYVNSFAQSFVSAVRATGGKNLSRNLVVNTYAGAHGKNVLSGLALPTDPCGNQSHLAVEVHSYDPWDWVNRYHMQWTDACRRDIENMFADLSTHIISKGYPVIIGEYGTNGEHEKTINKNCTPAQKAEAGRQAADMNRLCRRYQAASFYWMGLVDRADRSHDTFSWTMEQVADSIVSVYR